MSLKYRTVFDKVLHDVIFNDYKTKICKGFSMENVHSPCTFKFGPNIMRQATIMTCKIL